MTEENENINPQDVPSDDTDAAEQPNDVNAESSTAAEDSGAEARKESGVTKRINELTAKYREQERKNLLLEGELKALRETAVKPVETVSKALDPLDFDNDDDYQRALVREEAQKIISEERQRVKAEEKKSQEYKTQAQIDLQIQSAFQKGREKYTDFDAAMELSTATPIVSKAVTVTGDNMHEILYYLGKNSAVLTRLNSLPDPLAVGREIGKIEAKLSTKIKQKQTKAPPPTSSIPGGGDTGTIDIKKMSQKERFAKWEADMLAGV